LVEVQPFFINCFDVYISTAQLLGDRLLTQWGRHLLLLYRSSFEGRHLHYYSASSLLFLIKNFGLTF
jgi:hypothetical protein